MKFSLLPSSRDLNFKLLSLFLKPRKCAIGTGDQYSDFRGSLFLASLFGFAFFFALGKV
jgi:hypothetical protein